MKFISLFSGIGGFDLAFDRAGMECVTVCEIDKNAQAILRRHFPNATLYDDVRKVGKETHERKSIDLICGGFPCQDLSVAGKRAGLAGERSGLWFEFARVIDELEPRWVVIENVPGLLSSHKGKDFAIIIRWLAERGYGVTWRILDAQYFGVPQRRRRVFIVGSFGNGCAAEVLFERESSSGDIEPGGETWEGATRRIAQSITGSNTQNNGGGGLTDRSTPSLVIANTLSTSLGHHGWSVGDQDITNLQISSTVETGINKRMKPEQVIPIWHNHQQDGSIRMQEGSAPTVSKHWGTGGNNVPFVGVRRLTPTECERLQGFPDGWTDGQSDSTRYKQLGNAVAVPVVEWIGKRIMKAETCLTQREPDKRDSAASQALSKPKHKSTKKGLS